MLYCTVLACCFSRVRSHGQMTLVRLLGNIKSILISKGAYHKARGKKMERRVFYETFLVLSIRIKASRNVR